MLADKDAITIEFKTDHDRPRRIDSVGVFSSRILVATLNLDPNLGFSFHAVNSR